MTNLEEDGETKKSKESEQLLTLEPVAHSEEEDLPVGVEAPISVKRHHHKLLHELLRFMDEDKSIH